MTPLTESLIRLEERALVAEHLAKIPKCKIAAREVFRTIRHGQMKLSYAGRCEQKPFHHAASRTKENSYIGFVIAFGLMGGLLMLARYGLMVKEYVESFPHV